MYYIGNLTVRPAVAEHSRIILEVWEGALSTIKSVSEDIIYYSIQINI